MPALKGAEVWAAELEASGSLAAAAALNSLQLGSEAVLSGAVGAAVEYSPDQAWLLEALAALRASLRVLRLKRRPHAEGCG